MYVCMHACMYVDTHVCVYAPPPPPAPSLPLLDMVWSGRGGGGPSMCGQGPGQLEDGVLLRGRPGVTERARILRKP